MVVLSIAHNILMLTDNLYKYGRAPCCASWTECLTHILSTVGSDWRGQGQIPPVEGEASYIGEKDGETGVRYPQIAGRRTSTVEPV